MADLIWTNPTRSVYCPNSYSIDPLAPDAPGFLYSDVSLRLVVDLIRSVDDQFKLVLRRRLREIRERSGKTLDQAALASGVSKGAIKSWEDLDGPFNAGIMALHAYVTACGSPLGEVLDFTLATRDHTKSRYVLRLINRALKDPRKRVWVETFIDMLNAAK